MRFLPHISWMRGAVFLILPLSIKGPIEEPLRGLMGNHIYGCDDCLAACPWNKFAVAASDIRYAAKDDLAAPALADLA